MQRYSCKVSLAILGPFLTAFTGPGTYGVDKSFHRDYLGRFAIPASHVKGKLRMSLEEIVEFLDPSQSALLDGFFGFPAGENRYEQSPGRLKFSDLVIDSEADISAATKERTRTAIDFQSGTAAEHHLRSFEDRFSSDKQISFNGEIRFYAKDLSEAQKIVGLVRLGFIWLTNMGSEKGVGFGRLHSVLIDDATEAICEEVETRSDATMHLRIKPQEPIAVGGIQRRRTNYAQSERVLPGRVIKGSLATQLNRAFEIEPLHQELSKENAHKYKGFEKLVEYFSCIRITHAFPTLAQRARPVKIPLSAVSVDGEEFDVALSAQAVPMHGDRAPVYSIDWKVPKEFYEAASPQEIFTTHTEIDDRSRRSQHGNLFTESFLCPVDEMGEPVEWVCNVDFQGIEHEADRLLAASEFCKAVQFYFDGLGRENRRVELSIEGGYAPAAVSSKGLIVDGLALIALQSDALMLDPRDVHKLELGEDLFALYAGFWKELSSANGVDPCFELVDFFAHQSFKGGYLYHRYLGQVEREKNPNRYRPYYLTNAGSLFKLRVLDQQRAQHYLMKWMKQGLTLPDWATKEYGNCKGSEWKACPFVPENGYGEIAINLSCHWNQQKDGGSK